MQRSTSRAHAVQRNTAIEGEVFDGNGRIVARAAGMELLEGQLVDTTIAQGPDRLLSPMFLLTDGYGTLYDHQLTTATSDQI